MEYVVIAIAILVVALIAGISLLVGRGRRTARLDDDAAAGTTLTRPAPRPAPPQPTTPATRPPVEQPDAVVPEAPPAVELPPADQQGYPGDQRDHEDRDRDQHEFHAEESPSNHPSVCARLWACHPT